MGSLQRQVAFLKNNIRAMQFYFFVLRFYAVHCVKVQGSPANHCSLLREIWPLRGGTASRLVFAGLLTSNSLILGTLEKKLKKTASLHSSKILTIQQGESR